MVISLLFWRTVKSDKIEFLEDNPCGLLFKVFLNKKVENAIYL